MRRQFQFVMLFLVSMIFTCPVTVLGDNRNMQETKFSCKFIVQKMKDGSCGISFTSDGMIIRIKDQEFNIPNRQILATTSYEISVNGLTTRKYTDLFLIVDPKSEMNRTDILSISTSSFVGFITNSKNYSGLIDKISMRLNTSEKNYFSEVVSPKLDNPVNVNQGSQQLQQLLRTKICIRCDLRNANLEGADLRRSNLEGANLEGANLTKANLKSSYLVGANLNNANMNNTNLSEAFFYRASMGKANLEHSNVNKTNFQEANLSSAILRKSYTQGLNVIFTIANLSNSDLSEATLIGANFSNANLQNANLSESRFSNGVLEFSTFVGADLSNANLRKAKISGSIFDNAKYCQTILPNGKVSNQNCQ
jgi:uncharacterized protein YjbI with pentapeptide repeats